jgi:hypothetical protein
MEALVSRTQATGRAPSCRVAEANPRAGEVAEALPHLRVCCAAVGISVHERPVGLRGEPTIVAVKHGALAMPGNRPAGQHSRLNEE